MRRSLVVVIVTTLGGTARAEPPPPPAEPPSAASTAASELAEKARAQAAAGDLRGAAALFRAAHAADPRPELLCNVGVAFHKAQDLPRAQLYLGQCLTRVGSLDAGFAAAVRSVFATVEDNLRAGPFAPLDVTVSPATAAFTVSAFEPEDVIVGARVVWLPLGHHALSAHAEGHRPRTIEVDVTTATQPPVRIELEREVLAPPPPTTTPRRSRRPALVATGVTAGLGLGALGAYLLARSAADDAGETGISRATYDDRVERARFRQHLSWGLAGGAVLGAAASGWLWYRVTRAPVQLEVEAGGERAMAIVHGRF